MRSGVSAGYDPDEVEVNSGHFYQSFLRRLKTDRSSRTTYLDETYRSPRAPKKLRASEFEGGNFVLNKTLETLYDTNGKNCWTCSRHSLAVMSTI